MYVAWIHSVQFAEFSHRIGEANLACAVEDGTIVILTVRQQVHFTPDADGGGKHSQNVEVELKTDMDPASQDNKSITGMKWIQPDHMEEVGKFPSCFMCIFTHRFIASFGLDQAWYRASVVSKCDG